MDRPGISGRRRDDGGDAETRFLNLTAAFALFFLWTPWWKIFRSRELRSAELLVIASNAAAYFGVR